MSKYIKQFESFQESLRKKEKVILSKIEESVIAVNDEFKVKKVKEKLGKDLTQSFSKDDIAEELIKWVVNQGLTVDKISEFALLGGGPPEATAGAEGIAAPTAEGEQPAPMAAPTAEAPTEQPVAEAPAPAATSENPEVKTTIQSEESLPEGEAPKEEAPEEKTEGEKEEEEDETGENKEEEPTSENSDLPA